MKILNRIFTSYKKNGLFATLKKVPVKGYNEIIRPMLPDAPVKYNDVKVLKGKLFDKFLPWQDNSRPFFESGVVEFQPNILENGNHVVIVGGGAGVTAVKASQIVGKKGLVTIFEPDSEKLELLNWTLKHNKTPSDIKVKNFLVGGNAKIDVNTENVKNLSPEELPECDVLEVDCEGMEIEILSRLVIEPRSILVETHGFLDAPSDEVTRLLEQLDYQIMDKKVADRGLKRLCEEQDIHVICARKKDK